MNPFHVDWAAAHPIITFFFVWPLFVALMVGIVLVVRPSRRTLKMLILLHKVSPTVRIYGGTPAGIILHMAVAALACGAACAVCTTQLLILK